MDMHIPRVDDFLILGVNCHKINLQSRLCSTAPEREYLLEYGHLSAYQSQAIEYDSVNHIGNLHPIQI